jgi:beta-galactosidase beta subunit
MPTTCQPSSSNCLTTAGEPHQALCAVSTPAPVRKAVFKIPAAMLEAR